MRPSLIIVTPSPSAKITPSTPRRIPVALLEITTLSSPLSTKITVSSSSSSLLINVPALSIIEPVLLPPSTAMLSPLAIVWVTPFAAVIRSPPLSSSTPSVVSVMIIAPSTKGSVMNCAFAVEAAPKAMIIAVAEVVKIALLDINALALVLIVVILDNSQMF